MIRTEPFEQWPAADRLAYLQGTLRDVLAQERRMSHTSRHGNTKYLEKLRKQIKQAEADLARQ